MHYGCRPERLCSRCLEFEKSIAATAACIAGEKWAALVAERRPELRGTLWPPFVGKTREIALRKVKIKDARLREGLAIAIWAVAASAWGRYEKAG